MHIFSITTFKNNGFINSFVEKDKKKRKLVKKFFYKRLKYKSLFYDLSLPDFLRYKMFNKLNNLPRNSSKSRIKNRCVISGRGKGIFRLYKLSRIKIREYGAQGLLPGVSKDSW